MLARKSALIVFVNVLGGLLGIVALKFIALTGTRAFGSVGFALAIVGPFELLGDLGFNRAYLKRVSEGKDPKVAKATFRLVKLVLVCAMICAVSIALYVWIAVLGHRLVDVSVTLIAIALAYSTVRALSTIPNLLFDARRETAKTQISMFAEHLVRVPTVVAASLLIYAGIEGKGPLVNAPPALLDYARSHASELLALTYVLGATATLIVAFALSRHYAASRPSAAFAREMWRFGRPLLLVGIVAAIASYMDRIVIGYYFEGGTEVGYYFATQRITTILQIVPLAASTLLLPTVSERHAALDSPAVLRFTDLAERYTTMFVAPALVCLALLAGPIVNVLLTAEYGPAAPVLVLLAAYTFVLGLYNLHVSLLAGMDRPGVQARSALIAFLLNALLVLYLVPDRGLHFIVPLRGAVGAALATLLAFTAALLYLVVQARRIAHKPPNRHVLLQLLVAGALALPAYGIERLLQPAHAWQLLLFSAVYFAAYVVALRLTRLLSAEEVAHFAHAVDPRKLLGYIRHELRSRP